MHNDLKRMNGCLYAAITGGGTAIIHELLANGGMSQHVAGFNVPYSKREFDEFVGGEPEKYCSATAAKALALASLKRAFECAKPGQIPIGVGSTASLVKIENERRDRENHAWICVATPTGCFTFHWDSKIPSRNRQEAELAFNIGTAAIKGLGTAFTEMNHGMPFSSVFPGSFNPMHEGHFEIIKRVGAKTFITPRCEISLSNFDKSSTPLDIAKRDVKFPLYTNHRTFIEKEAFFRQFNGDDPMRFICGLDTWNRIDPRDYDKFHWNTKFIILGRDDKEVDMYHEVIDPVSYQIILKNQFLSSTKIRENE